MHITDVMNIDHLLQTQEAAYQTIFILINFTKHIHQEEETVADLSIRPDTQKMYTTKSMAGVILRKCKEGILLMSTELEVEKESNHRRGQWQIL